MNKLKKETLIKFLENYGFIEKQKKEFNNLGELLFYDNYARFRNVDVENLNGVFRINDYYFTPYDIRFALNHNIDWSILNDYYYESIECEDELEIKEKYRSLAKYIKWKNDKNRCKSF